MGPIQLLRRNITIDDLNVHYYKFCLGPFENYQREKDRVPPQSLMIAIRLIIFFWYEMVCKYEERDTGYVLVKPENAVVYQNFLQRE